MHPPRPALWCLLALATLPASSSAASTFEVDVVFPRNATYAPSDNFPVVLAFKNAGLAKDLQFSLLSSVWNGSEGNPHTVGTPKPWTYDLDLIMKEANVSSDEPLFLQAYSIDLSYEGPHGFDLRWDYAYCNDNIGTPPEGSAWQANNPIILGRGGRHDVRVLFTIKKDAPEVDLIAATSDEGACLAQPKPQPGVTVSLSGQTREYPAFTTDGTTIRTEAGTCEVQPVFSTTNATPCRVSVDATALASFAAASHQRQCQGGAPPADCFKPKSNMAGQPLAAVGMVASLTAALGVAGFLLG